MNRFRTATITLPAFFLLASLAAAQSLAPGETLHMPFEDSTEILADFVSRNEHYKALGAESLVERALSIGEGRFGQGLFIEDGSPKSAGTWNQSGLDCDLIVSVVWGEWRKKPHYWGAGQFYGDRGTVAFWVKGEADHRGVLFMQGSVGWGRKERDLFTVEVDQEGRLNAHLRDVNSEYHRVQAGQPTWEDGQWQHIAVSYDRAYGMKLYHNGALVGSTWGEDAWWQAPLPGLFSPFLQESRYDEIRMFDYPLDDAEIAALFEKNEAPANPALRDLPLDALAADRLLTEYGDPGSMDIPVVNAGEGALPMRQTIVASSLDEKIPVSFINDGRYELAWPTPYRLFTFVLGDADFHGENISVTLAPGENPNYISFEGALSGLIVDATRTASPLRRGTRGVPSAKPILTLRDNTPFFYGQQLALNGANSFEIPLVKDLGVPEDLEGSVKMPLTGATRIHEMQLWEVGPQRIKRREPGQTSGVLGAPVALDRIPRYGSALEKLKGGQHRIILPSGAAPTARSEVSLVPLQAIHAVAESTGVDAVDGVEVRLLMRPTAMSDVLWVKLRDPGNPSRYWTQACVRVNYKSLESPQEVTLSLDTIDLLLADGDQVLVELTFARGGTLVLGDSTAPSSLRCIPARNRNRSLEQYARHAMLPARMQYMKEYNYRPWRFTGDTITVDDWEVFGGPYDMAYPPLSVLRVDPQNVIAQHYKTLLFDRDWFGAIDEGEVERKPKFGEVPGAPAWATAQREVLALNWQVVDWIVGQQRQNGMFWGGPNDDSFIPLGWAALPLLGHEGARKSWLRFYDGLEDLQIYHDGYCDIWPIDPLHITDFICSRGLMLAYAPGNPQVFERELRTAERYHERTAAANAKRAEKGQAPLTGDRDMRDQEGVSLIDQMDSEIGHYSRTHVGWWWGETEVRPPHEITDRATMAAQMMDVVKKTDDLAIFGMTEARVHTDNQRGIARDLLITTALGGRLQGYTEPFPPSIAVSWEGTDTPDLARLVSYADDSTLLVNCYNFGSEALDATLRVFRLQPGSYDVSIGADANDDGAFDQGAGVEKTTMNLHRFSTVNVAIPPGQNYLISIQQRTPVDRPLQLPDVAISDRDIQRSGNTVTVTVHNIGAVSAENVKVALVDAEGKALATQTIATIESPRADLAAKYTTVTLELKDTSIPHAVFVDPANAIDEVFEENNEVVLSAWI